MADDPIRLRQDDENDAIARTVIMIAGPDGSVSELVPANIDGRQALTVRRTTGTTTRQILEQFSADPDSADLDTIGVLWWLARDQMGEQVTLDEVMGQVTYQHVPRLANPPASEDPDEADPPPPGGVHSVGA